MDRGAMQTYPRQLAPGLWVLGDDYTNLYLVRGRRGAALIEAGISAGVDEAIRQLEALGAEPDVVVVPHPHPDHVTGLPGLRQRYPKAPVFAGAGAREFLAHPRAAAAAVAEDLHLWEFYAAAGLTPGRPPLHTPPSLEGARVATDGEELDLGGATLRFLAVGGHSPGQLAVHLPEARALAVSDALGFRFPRRGFLPVYFTSYGEHLAALERFEALAPEVLCPAHLGPLSGPAAAAALRDARSAAQRLVARVQANRHRLEALAEELFREVYVDEFRMYTEGNIRTCVSLLIRRSLDTGQAPAGWLS